MILENHFKATIPLSDTLLNPVTFINKTVLRKLFFQSRIAQPNVCFLRKAKRLIIIPFRVGREKAPKLSRKLYLDPCRTYSVRHGCPTGQATAVESLFIVCIKHGLKPNLHLMFLHTGELYPFEKVCFNFYFCVRWPSLVTRALFSICI